MTFRAYKKTGTGNLSSVSGYWEIYGSNNHAPTTSSEGTEVGGGWSGTSSITFNISSSAKYNYYTVAFNPTQYPIYNGNPVAASATITVVLDGADGADGSAANTQYTDIRFRGVWNSSTRYYYATASSIGLTNYENPSNAYVRDQVIYKGGVYLVKYVNSGGVYGQTPSSSSSYWELVSSVSAMAINTLLADNAVLGAFHFSNNVFWSGDGGSSSSAAKLYMNSSTGEFRASNGTFTGTVTATSGTFTNGVFTNCTTTNLTINSGTLKMSSTINSSLGTPSQAYSITTTTNITGSGFSILSATSSNDLIRATFGSKVVSVYNSSGSSIRALAAIAIDGYYVSGRNTVTVPLYISAASNTDAAIFVDNGAFYGWNLPVLNISALINGVTFSCVCNVTSSGYTMVLNQGKVGTMVFMSVSNGYTYTIRRDSCAWISSTGVYQSAGTSSTTYNDDARIFVRVAYNTWQEYFVG